MRTIHAAALVLLVAACGDDSGDDDITGADAPVASIDAAAPGDPDAAVNAPDAAAPDAALPDAGPDYDAGVVDPGGDHHTYVVDKVQVPTTVGEATTLGQDLDGDGTVDNALGQILSVFVSQGLDAQGNMDFSVDHGTIIYLIDVQAGSLVDATGVGFSLYLGEDPVPAPCASASDTICRRHLDGTGSFAIRSDSPAANTIVGAIEAGHLTAGPGQLPLLIPLTPDAEPLLLSLVAARAAGDPTDDAIATGRLGGAVTQEEIDTTLLPAVHGVIVAQIETDCFEGACGPGSQGEQLLELFDTDGDGKVTLAEFVDNDLVTAIFAPDLDLFDAEGGPGPDGVNDSLSFGVGFSAVTGTFDLPE